MTYSSYEVGTAAFRQRVSDPKLRDLLERHPVVTVGRYAGEPAAVVVSPAVFAQLEEDHQRLEELVAVLPLLLAGLASGATVPSETLRRLGIDLDDDSWQTLNDLQRRFPVRVGYGEDGERIARGALSSAGRVEELDEELFTVDD